MNGLEYYQDYFAALSYMYEIQRRGGMMEGVILTHLRKQIAQGYRVTPGTILDMGSGPGNAAAIFIEELGFEKMIAVDGSRALLSFLPHIIDMKKVQVTGYEIDLESEMPDLTPATVDFALSIGLTGYLSKPATEGIFQTVAKALKKDACFGFSLPIHTDRSHESIKFSFKSRTVEHYAHSGNWIQEVWKDCGFHYSGHNEAPWDTPLEKDIRQILVVLRKAK